MSGGEILRLEGVRRDFVQPSDMIDRLGRLLRGRGGPSPVRAVAGVDLDVRHGEVLAVVGESGCGKTTLGRMLTGIIPPTAGRVLYRGRDVATLHGGERRAYDLAVQMIFQDPFSSLNPRMRVRDLIGEAPVVHGLVRRSEIDDYVCSLLEKVGLDPEYRERFPHQFSGGQRQRIGVARALALKPEVLVCDEAVAALDVSIQAQVLNLFMELRRSFDLTYVFISHNLGVVSHISDRVAIMYLGRIVELAPTETVFSAAAHPYTRALLKELPVLAPGRRRFDPIVGELPSPADPPAGCAFHPRCPHAMPRCRAERPGLRLVGREHWSACHLDDATALPSEPPAANVSDVDCSQKEPA
jgi:peptide/nickel transport system ATP-binding protein